MWRLFSKIVAVGIIILLFPTGLVLASQNAIPGDMTYPIKRSLENAITAVVSLHPATSAYFKTDLSKRRFKETMALIKRGDNITRPLNDLVLQTKSAADSVKNLSDTARRKQLTDTLLQQIDEYNQSLSSYGSVKKPIVPSPTPVPVRGLSAFEIVRQRKASQLQVVTPKPTAAPVPNSQDANIQQALAQIAQLKQQLLQLQSASSYADRLSSPTPTPIPTSTPTPTVTQPQYIAGGPISPVVASFRIMRSSSLEGSGSSSLSATPVATNGGQVQGIAIIENWFSRFFKTIFRSR